ncbi:hypothetical protein NEOLEDRAFT_586753 [Neolentinus lepideus HHB14362 ss-1]|uniref:Uncharacterized protein n=1 Tax=Neolentinus lepideus HHB14362 ss-1 TaxID=1314782 RepID=A0A165V7B8_9AGAM|nr:hypothetical protein NEOLEDRAFT_586753 [Neolentinus lepideus HHB14362 ss-1]
MSASPSSSRSRERGASLDLAWARDELASTTRKLSRVQEWLTHTIQTIEEESRTLQSEVLELRVQKSNDRAVIDALRTENERLKSRVDPPANARMQKDRDAILEKLRKTRKKMQDLLEETKSENDDDARHIPSEPSGSHHVGESDALGMSHTVAGANSEAGRLAVCSIAKSPECQKSNEMFPLESLQPLSEIRLGKRPTEKVPVEQGGQLVTKIYQKSESTGSLSGSGNTAKTHRVADAKTPELTSPRVFGAASGHGLSPNVTPTLCELGQGVPAVDAKGKRKASAASSQREASSSGGAGSARTDDEPEASGWVSGTAAAVAEHHMVFDGAASDRRLYLQHTKPPASSMIVFGPLSEDDLRRYVDLSLEDLTSIRLPLIEEHRVRVFIKERMAFLYDPIFWEPPRSSYLVNWASESANRETEWDIMIANEPSPVFHTFVFPLEKQVWYYVGAFRWKPKLLKNIWESLLPQEKHQLALILMERWQDGPGVAEISEMLTDRRLKQLSFELNGDQYIDSSEAFREELAERMRTKR